MVYLKWLSFAWLSGTAVSTESSLSSTESSLSSPARILFTNPTACLTRATAWLERISASSSVTAASQQRGRRMRRVQNHGGRLLMQQNSGILQDEWPEFDDDGELKDALRDEYLEAFGDELNADEKAEGEDPHPLRMQDWKLEMRLSPWNRREQEVSFHRNGTVWTSDGDTGDWWFDVGGLYWDVNTTVRAEATVFHHKAELHWNVFGSQPRMFRGTVTRDRLPKSFLPPWLFRPVISSFVGSGVGNDTADMSYRHRQMTEAGEAGGNAPARPTPVTERY